jgi:hypothetical protein
LKHLKSARSAQLIGRQLTVIVHAQPGETSYLFGGVTLQPPIDTPFGVLTLTID